MDLMHLHGMYRTIACVIETWGVDLDEQVEERLPDGVNSALFQSAV